MTEFFCYIMILLPMVNFDPSIGGAPFKYGHQARLFGHNAPQCHGLHMPRHECRHPGHRHGHHNHGPPSNRWHGHGHHDHGPHINRWHCHGPHGHGPHGHGSHAYGYPFHRPYSFGPHQVNQTFQPHHFWKNINHPKRILFSGPHQNRRGCCEDGRQGCNGEDYANLHNTRSRPHSI